MTDEQRIELCRLAEETGERLTGERAEARREADARWKEQEGKRLALNDAAPRMRDVIQGILDWYASLPNPGEVPNGLELCARLREAKAALP